MLKIEFLFETCKYALYPVDIWDTEIKKKTTQNTQHKYRKEKKKKFM